MDFVYEIGRKERIMSTFEERIAKAVVKIWKRKQNNEGVENDAH